MCVGILGVTLGSWWVSTGKLAEDRSKQVSAIDQAFTGVSSIMSQEKHPNPKTIEGQAALNRKYAQEVMEGWQKQFDQQAGVLVWSENFQRSGFRDYVDKLRPIEAIQVVGSGQVNIKNDCRAKANTELHEDELPKLAEIIERKMDGLVAR
jgi:hypothetical protein